MWPYWVGGAIALGVIYAALSDAARMRRARRRGEQLDLSEALRRRR